MGSLRTCELHLHRRKKENGSWVVFEAKNIEEEVDDEESETDERMAMLTKQFKKFLRKNRKWRNKNFQPQQKKFFNNSRANTFTSIERTQYCIQCNECEGYGHIASKCATEKVSYKEGHEYHLEWRRWKRIEFWRGGQKCW